jgi:hypothetical protein
MTAFRIRRVSPPTRARPADRSCATSQARPLSFETVLPWAFVAEPKIRRRAQARPFLLSDETVAAVDFESCAKRFSVGLRQVDDA